MPDPISGTYIDPDNVGKDIVGSARSVTDNANRTFAGTSTFSGTTTLSGTTNLTGAIQINSTEIIAAAETAARIPIIAKVALSATDTAGGVFAWANPSGGSILVLWVALDVTTQSSGACTVDVGVAADGTTLNDTIIDGVSVASTGVKDSFKDAGTNGVNVVKATTSQYVTGSVASGASSGLVGSAYIAYIRA